MPDAPTTASPKFSARVARVAPSATTAALTDAEKLRAAGRSLVDLGVGEPDFPTPAHVTETAIEALRAGFTRYTPNAGTAEARAAVCDAHRRLLGSNYQPEETALTIGGKQALFNAISVLVDHGDEVILPAPYWVSLKEQISYAGGKPVIVATESKRDFALDPDTVARALTPRTKAIVVNSPCNPTGALIAPEAFRAIARLSQQHDLWLISDECYVRLVYDSAPFSIAGDANAKPLLVVAGSFSKTFAMTGWRLGYALAPVAVTNAMLKVQSHSTGNATTFVQKAAIAALGGPQEPVTAMLDEYRRRRALIVDGLRAIPGITCTLPAGAFYAFPSVTSLLGRKSGPKTTVEFAAALMQTEGLITVAGEAFGAPGYIRLSYAAAPEVIQEGLRRLARYAASL